MKYSGPVAVERRHYEFAHPAADDLSMGRMGLAEILARYEAHLGSNGSFQARVQPWMMECFGAEISADRVELGDRLLEEVFELLQSGGYDRTRVARLASYVWNRPVGEPFQEAGGVMVTLAAYCLAHQLDMHAAGETELDRIFQPAIIEKIRAKQAQKARDIRDSPLPARTIGE